MRFLPVLGALVLVAMMANAARPCDNVPLTRPSLGLPGLVFVPFPAAVPTPGGHLASGAYVDNRGTEVCIGGCCDPCGWLDFEGDGTWLYLETNGEPGLQRGGASSVWPCAVFGCDVEFAPCETADPDELVY